MLSIWFVGDALFVDDTHLIPIQCNIISLRYRSLVGWSGWFRLIVDFNWDGKGGFLPIVDFHFFGNIFRFLSLIPGMGFTIK